MNANSTEPRESVESDSTVGRLFEIVAARTPGAIAVISEHGALTYGELDQRSNRLARHLRSLGVSSDVPVALCLERTPELIVALLAILKAGGAYLPLEPTYPKGRIAFMLEDAAPAVLLVEEALREFLPEFHGVVLSLDGDAERLKQIGAEPLAPVATPDTTAYILYTSGSTGQPKGVLVPHRAIERLVQQPGYATLSPEVTILQAAPVAFDASTFEIWGALTNGGRLALHSEPVPTARGLRSSIERFGATTMWLTAALFNTVIDEDATALAGLKELLTGGEALSVPHIRRALATIPGTQLINGYGPTETTTFATCYRIPPAIPDAWTSIPIGYAIRCTELHVLDAERRPVAQGEIGELYIGGRGVARGYLRRDDLTRERFIDDPTAPGALLYRTGDLVRYLDDGALDYVARADQQVKIRGFRIELGEIETALMKIPAIVRAVVMARADGEGEKRLVGYVVPASGQTPPRPAMLRAELGRELPDYMLPAAFVFVTEIPVTLNGKVDYRALPEPSRERPELEVEFEAPVGEVESKLAEGFRELIGIDRVGRLDNLFELGVSSLSVVRGVARLRERFGMDVPVVKVFQYPTVESLAAHLSHKATATKRPQLRRDHRTPNGVAIVGMAGRFPGAKTVEQFWQNLCEGVESISNFSMSELDPSVPEVERRDARYVAARGIVDDCDLFDAGFFGISPKEAVLMDPQQRVFFEVVWEALESAGYVPEKVAGPIGIFAGKYNASYYLQNVLTHPELIAELGAFQVMVANEKDYVATRVAHRLDLKGPALSIHTGCSTSLVATVEAVKSLELGQCDMAIAGGTSLTIPVKAGHLYQEGSMLSSDGHTRPFDAKATGTTFSDGVAVVILKRLDDAIAARDTIYGVIRGAALSNDGAVKASFTAPSVDGQLRVIAAAHADAGIEPSEVSYVETHGTATPLGDPIEVEALTLAFGQGLPKKSCGIGSVKSNVGHLVIAAGTTGLIKTALALKHEVIPATLRFESPNPKIDFESGPFYVVDRQTPWPSGSKRRLAGVSAFGVGGTNAHVVVEEAPTPFADVASPRSSEILLFSARSEAALRRICNRYSEYFTSHPNSSLADAAYTLQAGRREFPHRHVVVASTPADAAKALHAVDPKNFTRAGTNIQKVAFMFPGQGSQHVGMGAALYREYPDFRGDVDRCLSVLDPELKNELQRLVFSEGDNPEGEAELSQTSLAQPALFIMEYAVARQQMRFGINPSALLGHSVGEFVCAALASVLTPEDAVRLVAARGRLMQAQPRGTMLSVRLPMEKVEAMLDGQLAIASENAPSLCVVAGPHDEIEAFQKRLEAAGAMCRPLHTSHAFHSPMMEPVIEPFLSLLGQVQFSPPRIPIASTVTGEWLSADEAVDPKYWAKQLRLPVRFRTAVSTLAKDPSVALLEVGPRQTLATLTRQQLQEAVRGRVIASLGDQAATAGDALRRSVGDLWRLGITLDALGVHGPERNRIRLPTYAFDHKRYWVDRVSPAISPAGAQIGPSSPNVLTPQQTTASTPIATTLVAPIPVSSTQLESQTQAMNNKHRARIIEALCATLEETSGIEVSPNDSALPFVELGLDSLFLTQYALTVQKKFDVKVTFRELQEECPSMDALADRILIEHPPAAEVAPAPAAPPAQPVAVQPMPAIAAPAVQTPAYMPSPMAFPVQLAGPQHNAGGSGIAPAYQSLLEQQLQLMSQQLALLGGMAAQLTVPAPAGAMAQTAAVPAPAVPAALPEAQRAPAPQPSPAATAPAAATNAEDSEGSEMMKYDVKKAFGAIARIHTSKGTELTPKQRARLDAFVRRYTARTSGSKSFTQENRKIMADPRAVSGFKPETKELVYPIVVDRSAGSKVWDIDGNEYVDVLNGFGLNLFGWQPEFVTRAIEEQLRRGHEIGPQHPLNAEVSKLVCEFTGFDRAAFCNTGSEAVMGCMRVARTLTGRSTIAVMAGSYHGIFDEVLVRGTKKLRSIPAAPGILPSTAANVLVLDYGTPETLEILRSRANELAAIMVEPIQSRRPDFRPREFLADLRKLTEDAGIVYVWDEVVCGFRLAPGGAQEYFGIKADIASYGKVIGGGLPIGVIAGKRRFMDALDGGYWEYGDSSTPPCGVTYFAGTFVRHPLALAAAKAVLTHLKEQGPDLQRRLNQRVGQFVDEMNSFLTSVGAPIELRGFASLWRIVYTADQHLTDLLFYMIRDRGVHIYDGFPCFFTTAHSEADYALVMKAIKESVAELQDAGFFPESKAQREATGGLDPNSPPVPGARLGRDPAGNPAWFVPNPTSPGQYVKYDTN